MTRTVYLNGSFVPEAAARVSIFDRGFLMADAVYEVTSVLDGRLLDFDGHMGRLSRSLNELGMSQPLSSPQWLQVHRQLVAENGIDEGLVYVQVTRGSVGDRDFHFPPADTPPTVVAFTQSKPGLADAPAAKVGWKVISVPDLRWGRRDIKTVQLLYPSMAKMMAVTAGVDDAWFVEDGLVTEGTSNNAYLIAGGRLITRRLGCEILHGITRAAVLRFAAEAGLEVQERSFSIAEAQQAEEAFVTSATAFVMPIVEVDGLSIGNGRPGAQTTRLREIYIEQIRRASI